MAYIFYTICFVIFTITTLAYLTRSRWIPLLPASITHISPRSIPLSQYFYTPLDSSFANDIEAGLTSEDFDLEANVAAGDGRSGLDDTAKREIQKIMRGTWFQRPVTFNEARRIYMERRLESEGIGRDGRPKDPKFVSFS